MDMSQKIHFTLDFEESLEHYLKKNYEFYDFRIIAKTLDARGANRGKRPRANYTIEIIKEGESFFKEQKEFQEIGPLKQRPVIVGAGPAGLFTALRLMEYGIPCTILERGDEAHKRMLAISKFWRQGILDEESNVCYGEGGAGLFSDGKLITRIKSPHISYVMQKLVDFGAPPETAYVSNPHLGSNKIRPLIAKLTEYLKKKGCEIRYRTRVKKILFSGNEVCGVELISGEVINSDRVILATGHSASDMYLNLKSEVELRPKDYAVGVRIEHPRALIDKIQHGDFAASPLLGAARYRLSYHDSSADVGTYSFCMCPGGYVLSSGTETQGLVVNGMSNFARNSPWSNSALVVTVKAGVDFAETIEASINYQHKIEHQAYLYSQKEGRMGKEIPAQRLEDFLQDKMTKDMPFSSCPSGLVSAPLQELLPRPVVLHLKEALIHFDEQMKGYKSSKALLLAPETRTSSPVTIVRDALSLETPLKKGLYPCGEGAGYAGGITSSACDGVKVAEAIAHSLK